MKLGRAPATQRILVAMEFLIISARAPPQYACAVCARRAVLGYVHAPVRCRFYGVPHVFCQPGEEHGAHAGRGWNVEDRRFDAVYGIGAAGEDEDHVAGADAVNRVKTAILD